MCIFGAQSTRSRWDGFLSSRRRKPARRTPTRTPYAYANALRLRQRARPCSTFLATGSVRSSARRQAGLLQRNATAPASSHDAPSTLQHSAASPSSYFLFGIGYRLGVVF